MTAPASAPANPSPAADRPADVAARPWWRLSRVEAAFLLGCVLAGACVALLVDLTTQPGQARDVPGARLMFAAALSLPVALPALAAVAGRRRRDGQ